MRPLLLLVLAMAVMSLSTTAEADFEAGSRAFNAGDYATAAREFRFEAQSGNVDAMYLLGDLYATGRGVSKNDQEATRWYYRAVQGGERNALNSLYRMAESGSVYGEFVLGVLYFEGRGVPRDLKASAGWMTRAAKQKFPLAAHYLGDMYLTGKGVEKDEAAAVQWYTVAAEQANPISMAVLGGLYKSGRGAELDRVEAFKWLYLAVGRFQQMPKAYQQDNAKFFDNARRALIAVKREMSDDEISEGQRRAKAFVIALKRRVQPPANSASPDG